MKRVYFVYEISSHRAWDTLVIKGVFLNQNRATANYDRLARYWKSRDYVLCLGSLEPSLQAKPDVNVLHNLEELEATDHEE